MFIKYIYKTVTYVNISHNLLIESGTIIGLLM